MSGFDPRRDLNRPTLAMLPRVSDNLSFLFADRVRITQNDTGVHAETTTEDDRIQRVALPTASIACLMLGPGVSITTPAMATFFRHGTTIVTTGAGGILYYGALQSREKSTTWLQKQVSASSDEKRRERVARAMYEMRFGDEPFDGVSIAELRRMEGRRMQALYKSYATKYKLKPFRRTFNPEEWDTSDPVNRAFSSANSALYGVVHSVLAHLGLSPAVSFVHQGKQHSFVYDIADLYKHETTIPLAFSLHSSSEPDRDARRSLRSQYRLYRMIPRIIQDTQLLLSLDDPDFEDRFEEEVPKNWRVTDLWDPETGSVAGGVNYGREPFPDDPDSLERD
ncbi:type I-E CRISPR-associated endonuclease Cas1 [Spiractinospora alimapuensis]|uniref:type I-E CRISPR-associated endonuclease Cas1e n=1 Tax=Spiractinospora alimapuensis TaxID=2820884 RepID=UPI001F335AF0|nr:type I-E CRISPR-associated endonuclease Cas1e [Spiractinospora alimapuensis]QVQ51557.1 type I-E CRISPR-associated endonuclease Cas1 [Spiractinospora alimapuensis]